jgi:hypothetical protein
VIEMDRTTDDGLEVVENRDPWRGVDISVEREKRLEGAYRVKFISRGLMQPIGPNGEYRKVPDDAMVTVTPDLRPIFYDPPENPHPHLNREDYEAKAIEEVRKEIERRAMPEPSTQGSARS